MEVLTSRTTDADALDRIVTAARRAFAINGVKSTRMADVAEASGVVRSPANSCSRKR